MKRRAVRPFDPQASIYGGLRGRRILVVSRLIAGPTKAVIWNSRSNEIQIEIG